MRINSPVPIDLARTLSAFRVGGSDPSMRIDHSGVWRATRTPEGPATLHVVPVDGTATFEVTTWGPGADWVAARAARLIGAIDDASGFDPTDRPLRDLHRRQPGLRFGRSDTIVEALLPTIFEQKVLSVEAHRSWHQFQRVHGEVAPGPSELRLRPDPARIAEYGYAEFHQFGIERRRAETILRVCRRASTIDRLIERSSLDAQAALESVSGIGPWTSTSVAQQAFGDPDAVIVGDYHLPNLVAWNLAGEARADDARMLELLEPFRGHRARVVRLLGAGAPSAPRRGPGRAIRSIAKY